MRWDFSNDPIDKDALDPLVLHKALDIANTFEVENFSEEEIQDKSRTQAQEWYDNASKEEREEYRKRFPEIDNN